jgi:transposase-like protein
MDKEQMAALVADGYSHARLAGHFEVSQSTVRYWLKKHDLRTNNPRYNRGNSAGCCKKCGENRASEFHKKSRNRLCHVCKQCYKEIYASARSQRLDDIKKKMVEYKGGGCENCGYNRCLACLDFHHQQPETKNPEWKKMRHRSFDDAMKLELDKCQLLCRNCHGEVHWDIVRNV